MRLIDVSVGFRSRQSEAHVLAKDVNARLEVGRLTCLVGRNGMGKSTLLRTMAGFQPLLKGEIVVDDNGMSLSKLSNGERSRLVSVVLTGNSDVHGLTVEELVGLGRSPYTNFWGNLTESDCRVVDNAMALTGVTTLRKRRVETLSDGERQKAMTAKALAQQTPVMLLDEPTAFLDYPSKVETLQLLSRLAHKEGKAVLFSSHDLELAFCYADVVWQLEDGHLIVSEKEAVKEELLLAYASVAPSAPSTSFTSS